MITIIKFNSQILNTIKYYKKYSKATQSMQIKISENIITYRENKTSFLYIKMEDGR